MNSGGLSVVKKSPRNISISHFWKQGSGSDTLEVLPAAKKLKVVSAQVGAQAEGAEEDVTTLSDEDVTKLVGTSDSCKLEVNYLTLCPAQW